MKKKLLLLFTALLAVTSGYSQEMMDMGYIADFHKLKASGPFKIHLIKGESTKLEAKFSGIEASKLKWGVKDGVLSLQMNVGFTQREASVDINIYYKTLDEIDTEGVNLTNEGNLESKSLILIMGGSVSRANMKLAIGDLEIRASGKTNIKVEGEAEYLAIKGSLGANVNTMFMNATNANISATGGSEVYVWATKRLEARAVSGGVIYYRGNPEILKTSKSLGGIVKQVDENTTVE